MLLHIAEARADRVVNEEQRGRLHPAVLARLPAHIIGAHFLPGAPPCLITLQAKL